jgi:hypothetical protein
MMPRTLVTLLMGLTDLLDEPADGARRAACALAIHEASARSRHVFPYTPPPKQKQHIVCNRARAGVRVGAPQCGGASNETRHGAPLGLDDGHADGCRAEGARFVQRHPAAHDRDVRFREFARQMS